MKKRSRPFEVRVKENGKIRSIFLFSSSPKQISKKIRGGEILSIRKVPLEKICGVGEYLPKSFQVDPSLFELEKKLFLGKE